MENLDNQIQRINQNRREKRLEQVPTYGQKILESLYLLRGKEVRFLSETSSPKELEGVLDFDIEIGREIFLNAGKMYIPKITHIRRDKDQIFFKTEKETIYELVPPHSSIGLTASPEYQQLKEKISKKLFQAQTNALSLETFEKIFEERKILQNEGKQNTKRFSELNSMLSSSLVTVQTVSEFKILLECMGKNYYATIGTLEHENAHANKATSLGVEHDGYSLLVFKNGTEFQYQPVALIQFPQNLNEDSLKKKIAVLNAPTEYGNTISRGDKVDIKATQDILRNLS